MNSDLSFCLPYVYEYVKNRIKYQGVSPEKNVGIWVEPSEIKFKLANRFYKNELCIYGAYIRGGSWDINQTSEDTVYARKIDGEKPPRSLIKIEDMPIYRSFKEHFLHDIEWEDTEFYTLVHEMHKSGHLISTKYSPSRIDNRLEYIDRLYSSIQEQGYKNSIRSSVYDRVIVNIGRDGRIILGGDGFHRTMLSKLIGVERIPVRIFVRHQHWQDKRYHVYKNQTITDDLKNHPDIINCKNRLT